MAPPMRSTSAFEIDRPRPEPPLARVVDPSAATVRVVEWRTADPAVGRISKRGALKGIKFGFDTYAHKTKAGQTISLVSYSHIEQTDEEITKAANG